MYLLKEEGRYTPVPGAGTWYQVITGTRYKEDIGEITVAAPVSLFLR